MDRGQAGVPSGSREGVRAPGKALPRLTQSGPQKPREGAGLLFCFNSTAWLHGHGHRA